VVRERNSVTGKKNKSGDLRASRTQSLEKEVPRQRPGVIFRELVPLVWGRGRVGKEGYARDSEKRTRLQKECRRKRLGWYRKPNVRVLSSLLWGGLWCVRQGGGAAAAWGLGAVGDGTDEGNKTWSDFRPGVGSVGLVSDRCNVWGVSFFLGWSERVKGKAKKRGKDGESWRRLKSGG